MRQRAFNTSATVIAIQRDTEGCATGEPDAEVELLLTVLTGVAAVTLTGGSDGGGTRTTMALGSSACGSGKTRAWRCEVK